MTSNLGPVYKFGLLLIGAIFLFMIAIAYYELVPPTYYSDMVYVQYYINVYAKNPNFRLENFALNLLEPGWHNILHICHVYQIDIETLQSFFLVAFIILYTQNYAKNNRLIIFLLCFFAFPSFSNLLIGNTKALSCIVIILLGMPNFFRVEKKYSLARTIFVFLTACLFHLGFALLLFFLRYFINSSLNLRKLAILSIVYIPVFYIAREKVSLYVFYYLFNLEFSNFDYLKYLISWHVIVHIYLVAFIKHKVIPLYILIGSLLITFMGVPAGIRILDVSVLFYIHKFLNTARSDNIAIYTFLNLFLFFFYMIRFL